MTIGFVFEFPLGIPTVKGVIFQCSSILLSRSLAAIFILFCCGCATLPPSPNREALQLLCKAAHQPKDSTAATGFYLAAAENSLTLASEQSTSEQTKAEAVRIYNKAVTESILSLTKGKVSLLAADGSTIRKGDKTYQLQIITAGPAIRNPSGFDRLIPAEKIRWKQLKRDVQQAGIGAPFVGLQNSPKTKTTNRPPFGFAEPLTAIASFGKKSSSGERAVGISLLDPRKLNFVTLDKKIFPLRGDFTAPLAFFPKKDGILFGFLSMIQSDRVASREGIYFTEPYDPDKIPVLFVHGLASSPHAWMEFINNLNASPEFRRHYQVWVYLYPSGTPIVVNALRLRTAIADIAEHYPLKHKIVIIGHSMGGILARLQVSSSGDIFWNTLFGAKAQTMRAEFPDDSLIKKVLFFQASTHVGRVIFIATPHRGSNLALIPIASLPSALIRMPNALIREFNSKLKYALKMIDPSMKSIPTSISGLSPKSPVLKAMDKLPLDVPYHSIIGNRGLDTQPLSQSSDGIVPYWSSHLEGAESEVIVPTGHDAFKSPASVNEVLRILKLNEEHEK